MATINLGRVKPVFRGAYDASTAYVIDDIVTYQDETYIAITATTGNLPTVTANWTLMAEGGDVASTLTTQGDLLFRDGSGLQRLAIGNSGEALKVNSGANGFEFGTAGGIRQVIQDVKTDYTVTNSAGFIPNLDVTITPSSTSSKILIDTRLALTGQHGDGMGCKLQRSIGGGSYTSIGLADDAGSRQRSSFSGSAYTGDGSGTDIVNIPVNGIFLDSPNTTSAITYKVRFEIASTNYAGINIATDSGGSVQANTADALVMTSSMTCYEITV